MRYPRRPALFVISLIVAIALEFALKAPGLAERVKPHPAPGQARH
jgi:hypothetical protein